MEEIKELLHDEIKSELRALDEMELGSNEHKVAIDGLVLLMGKAVDIEKVENDVRDKEQNHSLEEKKLDSDIKGKELNRDLEEQKLNLEEKKLENDIKGKELNRDLEEKKLDKDVTLRKRQIDDNKKNMICTIAINGAGLLLAYGFKYWGAKTSLKFEETGTVTSSFGRSIFSDIFRSK